MNFIKNQAQKQQTQQKFLSIKDIKPNSKLNYVNNYIINQCQFFNNNYFESESTIARKVGCKESTVKRSVRLMRDLGIIKRKRRFNGVQTFSNVYSLNPEIRTTYWVDQLAAHLPALRNLLCLSFLLPTMAWCQKASDRCKEKIDPLYSNTKYLLEPDQNQTQIERLSKACAHARELGTGSGSELKRTEFKKKDKKLQGGSCKPLDKAGDSVMNYPFLEPNGQQSADILGLTMAGATRIAKYSEQVHKHAFNVYCHSNKVKHQEITEPLRYYISIANKFCHEQSITIDYAADNRFMMEYHISDSDEIYLPADQRVKVELPSSKHNKNKPTEGNPYREVTGTWAKSKKEFPLKHGELDHIKEAIKMVAQLSAGMHNQYTVGLLPSAESYMECAREKIKEMVDRNEVYNLDLAALIEEIDIIIDVHMERNKDAAHIRMISSPEDAKMKAHKAMAEFIPKLLAPFYKKDSL